MKYEKQGFTFYVGILLLLLLMVPTKDIKGRESLPVNGNKIVTSSLTKAQLEEIKQEFNKWLELARKDQNLEAQRSPATAQSTPETLGKKKKSPKNEITFSFSYGKVELLPELVPICACESRWDPSAKPTHWDTKGNVLLGKKNPKDIGKCQINEDYHGALARSMGLNIHTEEGNTEFANFLYERDGDKPWYLSKPCWGRAVARQDLAKK